MDFRCSKKIMAERIATKDALKKLNAQLECSGGSIHRVGQWIWTSTDEATTYLRDIELLADTNFSHLQI